MPKFGSTKSWREGKRVRTESRYTDPADGGSKQRLQLTRKITDFIKANITSRQPIIDEEQMLNDYNTLVAREQQARQALSLLGELHDKYGLRVADTPRPIVVAPEAPVAAAAPAGPGAKESPSIDEGQDAQNS
jgi:hypothetical protein